MLRTKFINKFLESLHFPKKGDGDVENVWVFFSQLIRFDDTECQSLASGDKQVTQKSN